MSSHESNSGRVLVLTVVTLEVVSWIEPGAHPRGLTTEEQALEEAENLWTDMAEHGLRERASEGGYPLLGVAARHPKVSRLNVGDRIEAE